MPRPRPNSSACRRCCSSSSTGAPQELLQTLARQLDPTAVRTNEVERFRDDVVAGRWPAVGRFLTGLPEAQRPQVYRHVLTGLQRVGGAPGMPGMPPGMMPGQAMPGMMPGMVPSSVLLPNDVLALADLAPGELTDEWLQPLGQLLGRAFEQGQRHRAAARPAGERHVTAGR